MDNRRVYSLAGALARIEALKKVGVWPAYYPAAGGWALSYDPPGIVQALDAHGYLTIGADRINDG